mgnify:CR=1 FL=1
MMTLLYLLLLPMLSGIGMLGLGPALMAGRAGAAHVVLLLSGLLLPLRGLMYLLLVRRRGNRPGRMSVLLAAVELLLGAGLLLLPQLSVRLFAVVVAVYLTLLVTVEAVNAILYGRMRRWGAFFPAMAAAVGGTGLFVLIVFVPALRDAALRYTAALLLTVFGTGLVCDVLALTIRSRRVRRVLGSIRVALPDLMSLFLPQRTADVLPRAPLGPVPQQGTEEFELLFQTSTHGIGLVGHCELCFDGRTLTYGAYDPVHQRLLRTAGAGIVFSAPREPYLRWCIGTHHRRVISYSLRLPPAQAAQLRAELERFRQTLRRTRRPAPRRDAAPQARRRAVLARAARAVCNVLHPDDQLRLSDERAAGENGHRPHGHARAQDAGRLSRPARARISGRKSGRDGPPGL